MCSLSLDHKRNSVKFQDEEQARAESPRGMQSYHGPWRSFFRPVHLQCHLRLFSLAPGNQVSSCCPVAALHREIEAAAYSQMASLRHPAFGREGHFSIPTGPEARTA